MKDLCGSRIQIHHFTVADPRRSTAAVEKPLGGALPKLRDGPDLIPPRHFDDIH